MVLEFTFPPPKIGVGKAKNQYATNNNVSVWYRFQKAKIKNAFKENLKGWYVPVAEKKFRKATVTFKIMRDSARKIDADAFGISAYKWLIDLIVEQGHLVDDDMVRIIQEPVILNSSVNETQIYCKVEFYD